MDDLFFDLLLVSLSHLDESVVLRESHEKLDDCHANWCPGMFQHRNTFAMYEISIWIINIFLHIQTVNNLSRCRTHQKHKIYGDHDFINWLLPKLVICLILIQRHHTFHDLALLLLIDDTSCFHGVKYLVGLFFA